MDQLHRETRRIILEARNQLEALEAASNNTQLDPVASSAVSAAFRENVVLLGSNASSLRSLITSEPPSRREVWKARLRDLDDQIAELRAGDARCSAQFRRIQSEKMMREELFQRRPGGGLAGQRKGGLESGDAVLRMNLADEHRSLENSGNMVSGILGTGRGALESLMNQRGRLREAKTKMLDVLNQIGVDRRLIASIERREYSDTMLAYGLMTALLVLLGLAVVWKYHRKAQIGA